MNFARVDFIRTVVDQHCDETAFLWSLRDAAVGEPHYSLEDLAELDGRLEAHLDGLRIAGDPGWEISIEAIDADDPGTIFAAAMLAFESADGKRIDQVVAAGSHSHQTFRALVSALAWVGDEQFDALGYSFLAANSSDYQRLAIAAFGARRSDPGPALDGAIESSDLFLRTRAIKAAGQLKRLDLIPAIKANFDQENHVCRFSALRSALLLGEQSALSPLGEYVVSATEFRLPAMQVALRAADVNTARNWLKAISADKSQMRDAMIGAGIVGDPLFIPGLINRMETPELARVAGEAFSMITGVDLSYEDLDGDWPEGFEAGPNDDPEDENVDMDADENLPWPNPGLVAEWWAQNRGEFAEGTRYLAGNEISPEVCDHVLRNGLQRQRNAAALEMALVLPDAPYFNTRAPGHRQLRSF